jgi:hypothetical protein
MFAQHVSLLATSARVGRHSRWDDRRVTFFAEWREPAVPGFDVVAGSSEGLARDY